MGKRSAALLLFISMLAFSQSVSFTSEQQNEYSSITTSTDSICAETCNFRPSQVYYQPNSTYTYKVNILTRIKIVGDAEDQTLYNLPDKVQERLITADVDISVYGPCELVLKLRNVMLYNMRNDDVQLKAKLEQESIHFAYEDGKVVRVCSSSTDDQWVVNLKKSIISLLQMTSSDVSTKQTVIESDVFGKCETIYEPQKNDDSIVKIIKKVKSTNKCDQRHKLNVAFMPLKYGLNQVLRFTSPFVKSNSTYECTQKFNKEQIFESVECENRNQIWPLNDDHKIEILSILEIYFEAHRPTLSVQPLTHGFRKQQLTISPDILNPEYSFLQYDQRHSVQGVQQLLTQINSHLNESSIQSDVPVLFSELTESLRSLGPQEQVQIWEKIRSDGGSSQKFLDIFLEASALAGNEGSADVLIRAFQQQQISQQWANYLFGLLSFVKQPSIGAVKRFVHFVQPQFQKPQKFVQIPRGVLLGITGFVHNFKIVQQHSYQQNVDQILKRSQT